MRHSLILFAIIIASSSITANAQNWDDEQLDVINSLKACWDTWEYALDQNDLDIWHEQCTDGDFSYWGSGKGAPNGPETGLRNFEQIKANGWRWVDVRPLTVKIVGDVAIMQFYGYWNRNSPDGIVGEEDKRTEIFQKVDGRWVLVAGHSTQSS